MSEKTETDTELEQPTNCKKCGESADAKIIVSSIHDGDEMESWHGVCSEHLAELGEWFKDE